MKAVKLLWFLSVVLFLGISLFVYGDVSDMVRLPVGEHQWVTNRQNFFYAGILCMALGNAVLLLWAHAFPYMPNHWILVPKKSYWINADRERRRHFNERAKEWVRGLAFLFNMLILVAFLAVYTLNSIVKLPIVAFLYVIGAMTVVWLIAFFPIFSAPEE